MIRYALKCVPQGHAFEAWFRSSEDYDRQFSEGLVRCAVCGSGDVVKALMTPAVAKTSTVAKATEAPADQPRQEPESAPQAALVDPQKIEALKMLKAMREAVLANTEDMGEKFAEEARRIHYGESAVRGIHGEATLDEARALAEEGIEVHALPVLPDDWN